ncbi:hypothetical protein [Actinomadura sp. 6N118]|uniref:hypothetical protein n=1 Tax=Actinomadura sp. 6N118 TaxID=3375151 RepID=UPI0037A7C9CC
MAAQAGYSGTPLPRKLGIKAEHRVLMVDAPDGFELDPLPAGVVLHRRPSGRDPYDVILAFCPDLATLERRYDTLRKRLDTAGGLWIAWPKKSSGVATDLSDDVVREYGLATGMVDNKVCAVDQTWSGQRFVVRLADR